MIIESTAVAKNRPTTPQHPFWNQPGPSVSWTPHRAFSKLNSRHVLLLVCDDIGAGETRETLQFDGGLAAVDADIGIPTLRLDVVV